MKAHELAKLLNGREIGEEITPKEVRLAEENGLLVAYGASDDLVEFRGVIEDEAGAPGVVCFVKVKGELMVQPYLDEDSKTMAERAGWTPPRVEFNINVEFAPEDIDATFRITCADAAFYPFNVMEDGELYCQGLVMDVSMFK